MANNDAIYISGYSCGLRERSNDAHKLCKWTVTTPHFDVCWACVCFLTDERHLKYLGYWDHSNPKPSGLTTPLSPNETQKTLLENHVSNVQSVKEEGKDSNSNAAEDEIRCPQQIRNAENFPTLEVTQEDACSWLVKLVDDCFQSMTCGWGWTAGVTENGHCYLWKDTEFEKPFLPASSVEPTRIVQVCLGGKHSTVLTSDGKPYEMVTSETAYNLQPLLVPLPVVQVSCGKEHVLMLTERGTVYSYGLGSRGQLGHGTLNLEEAPRMIEKLQDVRITSAAAGGWHSAALDENGVMYMWGWNESGQLGLPCGKLRKNEQGTVSVQAEPNRIEFPQQLRVIKISLGSRHSAAITDGGDLWSWGWNGYGQLNHGDNISRDEPTVVTVFKGRNQEIVDVRCRDWTTTMWVRSK